MSRKIRDINDEKVYSYFNKHNILNSDRLRFLFDRFSAKELYRLWTNTRSLRPLFRDLIFELCVEDEEGVSYTDRECGELYETLRKGLESCFKEFDKKYSHGKAKNAYWEYEDRVSITRRGVGSERETVIPSRYIKAILIKSHAILRRYIENEWESYSEIPVFYYNVDFSFYELLTPEVAEKIKSSDDYVSRAKNLKGEPKAVKFYVLEAQGDKYYDLETDSRLHEHLKGDESYEIRKHVAKNTYDPSILLELSTDPSENVLISVAMRHFDSL